MKSKLIASTACLAIILSACNPSKKNGNESAESDSTGSLVGDSVIGYLDPRDIKKNEDLLAATTKDQLEKDFLSYKEGRPKVLIEGKIYFIVQGDEKVIDSALFSHWISFVFNHKKRFNIDTSAFSGLQNKMIVGKDKSGKLLTYPPGTKLKFGITSQTFPDQNSYNQLKSDFLTACRDWENLCNIKLEYHQEHDNTPYSNLSPPGIDFMVIYSLPASQQPKDKDLIALSYYRNETFRKVQIFPAYFEKRAINKPGVLRHEIGHILGFRHEQISSAAPAECLGGETIGNVTPLTTYDYNSVMHYICGMFDNTQMIFTAKDTLGSQKLYGKPKS